jgi:hypothetical protein
MQSCMVRDMQAAGYLSMMDSRCPIIEYIGLDGWCWCYPMMIDRSQGQAWCYCLGWGWQQP